MKPIVVATSILAADLRRSLLHSQFEALEEPGRDENPIIVSIEPQPREIVAQILSALNVVERAQPAKRTSLRSSVLGAWTNP
ncbi:MAG: hypothetical protein ACLPKB_12900 [Xanthobacteraceae bacterium]